MRSGKLDKNVYADLLKNGENFYELLTEQYARAIDKLIKINKIKEWFLTIAYGSFVIPVFATIVVVLDTFALQP